MLALGTRPTPRFAMRARSFPPRWRQVIETEITAAQISARDLKSHNKRLYKVRWRVWQRLHGELGVCPYRIAKAFGFHHTTVLYALGRITK